VVWKSNQIAFGAQTPKKRAKLAKLAITLAITIISNKLTRSAGGKDVEKRARHWNTGYAIGIAIGIGIVRAWPGQFMLTFWAG